MYCHSKQYIRNDELWLKIDVLALQSADLMMLFILFISAVSLIYAREKRNPRKRIVLKCNCITLSWLFVENIVFVAAF